MQLEYRPAVPADLDAIMALVSAAIEAMEREEIHQWDEIYPSRAVFAADIAAGTLILGFAEGHLAVLFALSQESDPAYDSAAWLHPERPYLVLHRLCVAPAMQGCGVASQTMRYIETLLRAKGAASLRLDVFTQNPRALALYQRMGFRQTGEAVWRKGQFLLMEKVILPPGND